MMGFGEFVLEVNGVKFGGGGPPSLEVEHGEHFFGDGGVVLLFDFEVSLMEM